MDSESKSCIESASISLERSVHDTDTDYPRGIRVDDVNKEDDSPSLSSQVGLRCPIQRKLTRSNEVHLFLAHCRQLRNAPTSSDQLVGRISIIFPFSLWPLSHFFFQIVSLVRNHWSYTWSAVFT